MRHLILGTAAVLIGVGQAAIALGAWAPISGVDIQPDPPSTADPLTILAYGDIGSTDMYIAQTSFSMQGTSQVLDIFFESSGIGLPVVVSWSHSEHIGTLPAETYSLTVRTYQFYQPADTFTTSFTVVSRPSIPGDTNGDNIVNETDAQALAANWGQSGGWAHGDFNSDGIVNAADASIMAAHWGDHTGDGESAGPEPSTLTMLLMGVVALMGRKKR